MEQVQNQQDFVIDPQDLLLSQQSTLQAPTYEELQLPSDNFFQQINENFSQYQENISQKFSQQNEWQHHFDLLNEFRIWNKFNNQQFTSQIIDTFLNEILGACENLRSQVQRLGLKLIKEIYTVNQTTSISNNSIYKLTQKLYEKANFEKKFIRDEALASIECLQNNKTALSVGVFKILQDLCYDKNFKVCELACDSMNTIMEKNIKQVKSLDLAIINPLVQTLSDHIDGKRAKLKILSKQMCIILKNQISENIFEFLPTTQYNTMKRLVLDQKKTAKKPNNFRDFKRTQTSMLKSSTLSTNEKSEDDDLITLSLNKAASMDIVPEFQNNNKNQQQIQDVVLENQNDQMKYSQISNEDLHNDCFKKPVLQESTDKNQNNENINLLGNQSQQSSSKQQQLFQNQNYKQSTQNNNFDNNENNQFQQQYQDSINTAQQKSSIRMDEETDEV